jgi:S-DNA-T family DNA segregation ATPase FtsK/SpoIIIE
MRRNAIGSSYRFKLKLGNRELLNGKRGTKTRIAHLKTLAPDLAAELGVSHVKVVSGKGGVWLEIPKAKPDLVLAREINELGGAVGGEVPLVLGRDTNGEVAWVDLSNPSTPHVLVAGTTGSGKSILLHALAYGLIANTNPCDVNMIMIDTHSPVNPNTLTTIADEDGLGVWRNCLHVYKGEVVTTPRRALEILKAAEKLVRHRLSSNSKEGVRYVIFIDELVDLFLHPECGGEIQAVLIKILQNARKCGVSVVAATQRPSHDVCSGLLKANFPVRVAMTVASSVDSRVVLGMSGGGAEYLNEKGDGILRVGMKLTRFQGAWVGDEDVRGAEARWKKAEGTEKSQKGVPKWLRKLRELVNK